MNQQFSSLPEMNPFSTLKYSVEHLNLMIQMDNKRTSKKHTQLAQQLSGEVHKYVLLEVLAFQ